MNPLPKPNDLRKITKNAIKKGIELKNKKLVALKEEEESKQREYEALAATILESVPQLCQDAAEKGKDQVVVMALIRGRDYERCQQLKGVGGIVWNSLQEAKLNPSIDYWYDGGGMDSGFNLSVQW